MKQKLNNKKKIAVGILSAVILLLTGFLLTRMFVNINGKYYFVFTDDLDLFYYNLDGEPCDNTEVEDIARLKRLKTISIQGNNITDVSFLENMTSLETLLYWGNSEQVDFTPIQHCENLKEFCGGNFQLENLAPFKECISLTTLSLEYVESRFLENDVSYINDISDIKNLVNLEKLYIKGENITDISALKYCTKLKTIDLYGTNAVDYSVLLELPELKSLSIDKGVLTESEIKALKEKGVEVREQDYSEEE
ncbi:MAG: leucine-rich repeat domain-containing protein [Ruminococcus sp.]|nr:leucine-rich repeat domain-containing protein [Ruminococcus sp.]